MSHSRRKWLQISFRTLAVLVALGCVWLASESNRARRQRSAVESLIKAGAKVTYDYEVDARGTLIANANPPGPLWLRHLVGNEFFERVDSVSLPESMSAEKNDAILAHLQNLPDVRGVNLTDTAVTNEGLSNFRNLKQLTGVNLPTSYPQVARQITDEGIGYFSELTEIRAFDLDHTSMTDSGLERLKNLTKLHTLSLNETKITDQGLAYLNNMRELVYLSLGWTRVTSAGMRHLQSLTSIEQLLLNDTLVTDDSLQHFKNMSKLSNLALNGCPITDNALPALYSLPSLRLVQLENTKVTQQGVDALKKALPGCRINW
ncbi:MAG: hypothetical protein KDB23_19995 [Planctomycetales bacterium]|nr:hypothetical protein [Planctomycetales bacterium]